MESYHNVDKQGLNEFGVPEALRQRPQWMGTCFERKEDGRVDKPPYRLRPGQRVIKADKTEPANWATFEEAQAALERGVVDAIGYVFTEDDPFFCVDLDDIVDPETGEIDATAAEVIHALDTYREFSCSRKGIHAIGVGRKPEWAQCKTTRLGFGIELYDNKRFVVITGHQIGVTDEPKECQEQLDALCRKLWLGASKFGGAAKKPPNTAPVDLEDAVLLERARTSRSGPKFHKLYDLGDTSGYPSHSDADYALLNALIFWTAGDRDRIIDLFEASALYRQKQKHRGYVALSVDNALATYKGSFYQPKDVRKARKQARKQEAPDPLTPYLRLMLNPSAWAGRRGASAYKAFTAAVILASEDGIIDDDGDLQIGCDIRRLAERAGTSYQTLSRSALPYLMKDMKLLKWKRGKGTKAGVLVLKKAACITLNTKVRDYFSVRTCATPKNAIETLGLLIRMRYGYSKSDTLLKLGMPAMFVAVALASDRSARGYTLEELAEATGRRKYTLDSPSKPDTLIKRLKAAGIVQETEDGRFRLTGAFRQNYERALEYSGITYAEREQKRRHAQDRKAQDAKLPTDKRPTRLRSKEQMIRLLTKRREEERRRKAAGAPTGDSARDARDAATRIEQLVRAGMKRRFARMEVLAKGHTLDCSCEVCG